MSLFVSIEDMARAMSIPRETFRKFWSVALHPPDRAKIPSSNTNRTMRGYETDEAVAFLRGCTPITDSQEAVLRSFARRSIRR